MLPYFDRNEFYVGPLTIHVWGLFIALGIFGFLFMLRREARARHISFDALLDMTIWVLIAAFVGARLSHVFFYEPTYFLAHPTEIIAVWNGGLSSLGGIFVGTLTAIWYVVRHRLDITRVGDSICRALPAAWIIGRFGCYITHMHPGVHSTAFFAVAYPDGGRIDLGLLESAVWLVIGILFWGLPRSPRRGMYITVICLLYAPTRFAFDFFRASDTAMPDMRYGGFTPAQFGMAALFIFGIFLVFKFKFFKKTY